MPLIKIRMVIQTSIQPLLPVNYDQLFNPYRFYGHDRLEDNNFLSLGVSYSLFDTVGLERLRASVGQSYYFEDRRVTLQNQPDTFDTERNTGPVVSLTSQLNQNFTIAANSAWMSNGDNAQRDFQVYYTGDKGNLYNLGYFYRKDIPLVAKITMTKLLHRLYNQLKTTGVLWVLFNMTWTMMWLVSCY